MKSMVRQLIAVTFGLCLSMLFSICSFASTGYPWFQVPNNATSFRIRLFYKDSSNTTKDVLFSKSSGNVFYLAAPSDFDDSKSAAFGCRLYIYCTNTASGYYGATFENSNFTVIDNEPQLNISGSICWASKGYYSNTKFYSLQTTYLNNPSSPPRLGTLLIFKPSGVDGGTQIKKTDFPLTCKLNSYIGQFNYAGIPDDGVYNTTTINSNKSNTAITMASENTESINELSIRVTEMESDLASIGGTLIDYCAWIARMVGAQFTSLDVGTTYTAPNGTVFTYPNYYHRSYNIQDEHLNVTSVQKSGTLLGILNHRLTNLLDMLKLQFDIWFQWFYPLKDANPQYWHVYNTDTDSTDVVNPATVTYYITWYLGQLFLMNNDNTPLGNLQDSVDDIKDQLVNVENQEQSIITSIRNGIDNFTPDLSQIGSFKALSWCSNYLQQIYVSLGAYGTVILIGLLLGVCMQFIGYFRYK